MPFDGVARIIRASQKHSEGKYIFRFPLEVVDEYGKLKYKNPPFKTDLTSGYEFLLDKLSGKISSAACEYVFIYQTPLISIKKRLEQQYFSWNGLV